MSIIGSFKKLFRADSTQEFAGDDSEDIFTRGDERELVNGQKHKLNRRTARLYLNLNRFDSLQAQDVMIARAGICGIPEDATLGQVTEIMSKNPHSRYPIYRHDLDNVKGFVHIKDIFMLMAQNIQEGNSRQFQLKDLQREVLFISPSMRLDDLLFDLRKRQVRLAIVVDEYGGVDGLVSIEDVLEEIVGEIRDEYDEDISEDIKISEDGYIESDARATIEGLEQRLGKIFGDKLEDFDTLGGLMFYLAARVPTVNEVIVDEETGINFQILDSDGRRIKKVRFKVPRSKEEDKVIAGDNKEEDSNESMSD